MQACGPLLKLYQSEIDTLTKRGNKASKAYSALLDKTRELDRSASTDTGDAIEAALAGGSDEGASYELQVRTQELAEMAERLQTMESEKERHSAQLEQVTAAMEREALAKAELNIELHELREEALSLRAAEASRTAEESAAELEQQLAEWQATVAELQSELRSAHEQKHEWEAQVILNTEINAVLCCFNEV